MYSIYICISINTLKMATKSNFYGSLYFESNSDSDTETNFEDDLVVEPGVEMDPSVEIAPSVEMVPAVDISVKVQNDKVDSEFLNSKSIGNKNCRESKRFSCSFHKKWKEKGKKSKNNFKTTRHLINGDKIFDEMCNLPPSLQAACNLKQNLTLKQILVLMNLHAMPGMAVNVIHDKIQLKVRKMMIKISHDGRQFHVSYYHWYDLKHIERMIDDMFDLL